MPFPRFSSVAWAALLAAVARVGATPVPLAVPLGRPQTDLAVRGAVDMASHHLEKRLSADFSLDRTWDNEVLFSGSWANHDAAAPETVSLSVVCLDCYTKGTVTAKLTDKEIINPKVRLTFDAVEAYVNLELAMSAGATYTVNLFSSDSPIGLGFPGLSVGVVFYVDLVFSLTEAIDLEGGFFVRLAEGSYLEASVLGGDITKHFFDGIGSKSLPVTVKSGRATFKADLRLRVQCGAEAELDLFGIGAGAEMGIYANLIEFVAVLDSTPTCELQSTEWWDLNVGAFAHLDVVVDYKTAGAVPTVSTTLLTAPTLTQCWIPLGGSPAETGGAAVTTVATTISSAAVSVSSPRPSTPGEVSASSRPPTGAGRDTGTSTLATVFVSSIPTGPLVSAGVPSSSSSFKFPLANSSIPASSPGATAGHSSSDGVATSTPHATAVYTITSCAASVVNCPASLQQEVVVTKAVDLRTTVRPASAAVPAPSSLGSPSPAAIPATEVTVHLVTDVIVLVPCASPVVETFVAPSTVVPPAAQQVTATALPVAPSGGSPAAASSSPALSFLGAEGRKYQWSNGTFSSASSLASPLSSAYPSGPGKPSATRFQTSTTPAGPQATAVTAGAAGRGLRSLMGIVGVAVAAAVMLWPPTHLHSP